MKTINCTAELTPDGQLILPPEVAKKLKSHGKAARKIIIFGEKKSRKKLTDFCGKWQDQRDADEIISEIYSNREQNYRSERCSL